MRLAHQILVTDAQGTGGKWRLVANALAAQKRRLNYSRREAVEIPCSQQGTEEIRHTTVLNDALNR